MNIRKRKLILYFLSAYYKSIANRKVNEIDPKLLEFFSRKELILMIIELFDGYDRSSLAELSDIELLEIIGEDSIVLSYVIKIWRDDITATPIISQQEVHEFFDQFQMEAHYLRNKPMEEWDEYDRSNYYSILWKRGKTRRVFAIFTSEVNEEDKYIVSTKPSFFFDTKEEAEQELERCIVEENFNEDDLKIMSLWRVHSTH